MKSIYPALVLSLIAFATHAQALQGVGVNTVTSGIGEENLAPLPRAVSAAAVVGSVVSETLVDPFLVKGVVVTLSNTTGFDRDAALEQGARGALPGVLVAMGIAPEKAAKSVKSLGSAMPFVKSFKVVKESLIPVYTLTTDLTFNGPMIQKNFGGKLPVAAAGATNGAKPGVSGEVSGTTAAGAVEVDIPATSNTPVKQWVVRIVERDPAQVDKVRLNLNSQPGTKATYRLLTAAGAELVVDTPLSASDISRYAGHAVDVVELEIPLPVQAVVPGSHPWQGQEEPAAPRSPSAPNAPGAPASPIDPNVGY